MALELVSHKNMAASSNAMSPTDYVIRDNVSWGYAVVASAFDKINNEQANA